MHFISREHIGTASNASSVPKDLLNINRDFLSLSLTIINGKLSSSAAQDEHLTFSKPLEEYRTGIKEVERFLSKLRMTTLLFPKEALKLNESIEDFEMRSD